MNILLEDTKIKINAWLDKFLPEQKQSAVLPALIIAQEANAGYLSTAIVEQVAEFLEVPVTKVYDVASFHSMLSLKPVGKYKISLCTNIACMLCKCDELSQYLQKKLAIKFGEVTKDGKFSLEQVECLALCDKAPVLVINQKYYHNVTVAMVEKILSDL